MLAKIASLFERKSDPDATYRALVAAATQTAAQIAVSPERAMSCVPVYAGTRVRCETIGALPFMLYERKPGGGKERAVDHPLYKLIHDRPNEWTSAAEFVMQIEKDCITEAFGYALANRAGDKVVELIHLPAGSVQREADPATMEPRYKVTLKNGGQKTYGWRDIFEVPSMGGLSPVKQAREAIGLYLAMEQHAGRLFGSGGRPSGLLKSKAKLSPTSHDRLQAAWDNAHGGSNSGRTAILEEGLEFVPLTFNSVDLQFQELRSFQLTEIARALGVPPMLLMDFGRATWGNSEQMAQAFLTFTILPRLKLWQGAVARLLTEAEQEKFVPEFLVDELVKAEIAARFEAYAKAITNGFLNPNEVRALENRPPYEGGEAFRLPMNTETPTNEPARPAPQQAKPRIAA